FQNGLLPIVNVIGRVAVPRAFYAASQRVIGEIVSKTLSADLCHLLVPHVGVMKSVIIDDLMIVAVGDRINAYRSCVLIDAIGTVSLTVYTTAIACLVEIIGHCAR